MWPGDDIDIGIRELGSLGIWDRGLWIGRRYAHSRFAPQKDRAEQIIQRRTHVKRFFYLAQLAAFNG
jgi:hypothetical protein